MLGVGRSIIETKARWVFRAKLESRLERTLTEEDICETWKSDRILRRDEREAETNTDAD